MKKMLLILFIAILLLSGCKKKEEEPKEVIETKQEKEKITSVIQYMTDLKYYALLAYEEGYCKEEYLKDNICTFKLDDLKKLIEDYDLTIFDTYNDTICDSSKVAVSFDLSKPSGDDFETVFSLDEDCMYNTKETPNIIK